MVQILANNACNGSFIPFPSRFGAHPRSFDPPGRAPPFASSGLSFGPPPPRERGKEQDGTCERGTTQDDAGTRPPSCRAQLRPRAHRGTCRRVSPSPFLHPRPHLRANGHANAGRRGAIRGQAPLPLLPPLTRKGERARTPVQVPGTATVASRSRWGKQGGGGTVDPPPLPRRRRHPPRQGKQGSRTREAAATVGEGGRQYPRPSAYPARAREAAASVPRGEGADGTREREAALDSALAPLPRSRPLSPRFAPTLVYHSTGGRTA
ncbi:hypothetical protein V8E53_009172 [Lactarius tabidus]